MDKADINDIKAIKLFENLKKETLERLSEGASKLKLQKGECLFSEKDMVSRIYVILEGKTTIYRSKESGQKKVVYILNSGELINEVIFDDMPVAISCEAFEESVILFFQKEDLMKIMSEDFEVAKIILSSMSKKIRALYKQLKNSSPLKIDKKLAAKLWNLCKEYGKETKEGTLIDLNMSMSYLADMLGSTRETISSCISAFEKNGMIKMKGKKILVRDPRQLSIYFRGR